MTIQRWAALALCAALIGATAAQAAELPARREHANQPKHAQPEKTCAIAGAPGVLAANNVCVRFSGYVSTQFTAGRLK